MIYHHLKCGFAITFAMLLAQHVSGQCCTGYAQNDVYMQVQSSNCLASQTLSRCSYSQCVNNCTNPPYNNSQGFCATECSADPCKYPGIGRQGFVILSRCSYSQCVNNCTNPPHCHSQGYCANVCSQNPCIYADPGIVGGVRQLFNRRRSRCR